MVLGGFRWFHVLVTMDAEVEKCISLLRNRSGSHPLNCVRFVSFSVAYKTIC